MTFEDVQLIAERLNEIDFPARSALSDNEATMLSTWVQAGGILIFWPEQRRWRVLFPPHKPK